jgi:hypothetical protein
VTFLLYPSSCSVKKLIFPIEALTTRHKLLGIYVIHTAERAGHFGSLQGKILVLGRPTYFIMYLLYLDESGEPSDWENQSNFVIAGIAVHEYSIYNLHNKLATIQQRYFPSISVPIVFHASHIHSGKGIFRSLHEATRENLLRDLYQTIYENRFPGFLVLGAIMDIDSAKTPNQVRCDTFEEVIASFNSFLVVSHRLDRTNKGLVILDKNRVEQYRQLLDELKQEGTKYGFLGNIVDIPYFARCRDTPLLQFADLCSYAMYRYYEKKDDTYIEIIKPRIWKNLDGRMFGMKHITEKDSCDCITCSTQTLLK